MRVHIVFLEYDLGDVRNLKVEAVFSTQEYAEEYINHQNKEIRDRFNIDWYHVDKEGVTE